MSPEYCAGFFDGEGSVYAAVRKGGRFPSVLVCIGNTNREVLQKHADFWGGTISFRKSKKPRHQDQWQWILSLKMGTRYLRSILPFLIIKKEVVEEALKYAEIQAMPIKQRMTWESFHDGKRVKIRMKRRPEITEQLTLIWSRMRELNKRGIPHNARRTDLSWVDKE